MGSSFGGVVVKLVSQDGGLSLTLLVPAPLPSNLSIELSEDDADWSSVRSVLRE